MIFGNAQIHLRITYHGESLLGTYLMTIVAHANIFKRELLLVHGSRSKQGCFNSLLEPGRSDTAGIADLLDSLDLMSDTLSLTITDGYVTGYLFPFI